ncbi:putative sugar and nucleotide-binding domains containing protein [Synechococcus sp. MEDNS5]|uniref:four-carbon acid sugar kinase family protein n=1 Tax=Synechococcus sp. MEDNS5 TaxID=1442554 RepID=UPI001649708A|nr:four-carbon acid sugar kinase family protein [Synechococcus sp. MEDNS5]QNJ04919.1 putative sugar and nucleotide-binding domains containing protein [Synechococcus sp. MEDNS5]
MTIVVIDDDPTGSQTVHSCPLLLRWDVDSLRRGLRHPSPLLFVLANTRALSADAAAERNREIIDALQQALEAEGIPESQLLLVSRGDSTLRGHGVLEPAVIAEELDARFGPVAATLHVPAFLPGGRTTVDGVHLLHGEPVHTTAFAKDRSFGFSTSALDAWLEEKSGGTIPAHAVLRLGRDLLDRAADERSEGSEELLAWLQALQGNAPVVVDAERPQQLDSLGAAVRRLQGRKRLLFRAAASLINGLVNAGEAPLGPQPLSAPALASLRRRDLTGVALPGLVLVGSHVPLADAQLAELLADGRCAGLELPVARIARVLEGGTPDLLLADLEREWGEHLQTCLAQGRTPVLFTSRGELTFGEGASAQRRRLQFGLALAQLTARLVAALAPQLGYVISKGGITTGTLLAEGLELEAVQLEGQLLPGLSLVRPLAPEGLPWDGLPIVTFPGNLGDRSTLAEAWRLMEAG